MKNTTQLDSCVMREDVYAREGFSVTSEEFKEGGFCLHFEHTDLEGMPTKYMSLDELEAEAVFKVLKKLEAKGYFRGV